MKNTKKTASKKAYYNEKNIALFRAALAEYSERITNGESLRVSVSNGNKKMGDVKSISLLPFITCPASCASTCGAACYAAKLCTLYKNTLKAYARNTAIAIHDPAAFWKQAYNAVKNVRFFRWNVSGDILNADFFEKVVNCAVDNKHCKFLLFTKKYNIVNAYINAGGKIPKNLRVIFSEWAGLESLNPYNMPKSNVIMPDAETVPENWKTCGGNCFECFEKRRGCWALKPGDTIAFKLH